MSSFHYVYKNELYPDGDGITKISDPFWLNICRECGHKFLSCLCTVNCTECGSQKLDRVLGGIPYEQIIMERGEPIKRNSE